MKTASRRFLVLVFAGTFAAAGARGGTSDGKAVTATATEEQPEEYKNWIELGYWRESSRAAIARSSSRNTGYRAIRFTAASRICTSRELSTKTAYFRSMVTRSGISTITT